VLSFAEDFGPENEESRTRPQRKRIASGREDAKRQPRTPAHQDLLVRSGNSTPAQRRIAQHLRHRCPSVPREPRTLDEASRPLPRERGTQAPERAAPPPESRLQPEACARASAGRVTRCLARHPYAIVPRRRDARPSRSMKTRARFRVNAGLRPTANSPSESRPLAGSLRSLIPCAIALHSLQYLREAPCRHLWLGHPPHRDG